MTISLDPRQARAVHLERGPLLALGGPGAGKTTVLEERFLHLVRSGTSPDRILFLVSNRAQKIEMQNRLSRRLLFDEGLDALIEVPVYTWHGLAYHLVTRHYRKLGYEGPPVLLTSPEQWGTIRDALRNEQPANWPAYKHLLDSDAFADEVVDFCIRAGQRALSEDDLRKLIQVRPEYREIVRFYQSQLRRLRNEARVDYPALLHEATSLVADFDDVRAALHDRWTHVLVDDGQELSLVQRRLLGFLAGSAPERSLVVAADPDSAIESFRGADPDWVGSFPDAFGGDVALLTTSYRLGPDAGAATAAVVAPASPGERPVPAYEGRGRIDIRVLPSLAAEMEAVARRLRAAHLDGVPFEEMAVLLASPAPMLPPLERALTALEVPFQVSVPDRPLEGEPAVRAFRDLARFALADDEPALVQLLRSPLAGLHDRDLRAIERSAWVAGGSLLELFLHPPGDLPDDVRAAVERIRSLRRILVDSRSDRADEAFWAVYSAAPYYVSLQQAVAGGEATSAQEREMLALTALSHALSRFVERRGGGTFEQYLEAIGRADFGADPWLPPERSKGGVQILSFHAAKGRQWRVVAVAGCIEGAIPKGRRARGLFDPYALEEGSPIERSRRNEAEDRRVFYVATTRARDLCLVTASPGASRRGRPSRFLEELNGGPLEPAESGEHGPLTFGEAAATFRRALADESVPAGERVAALAALVRLCDLDPTCSAARPTEWWWRWDWTEGAIPIRVQARRPDDDLAEDKLRTSYSRISNYENCPLQYLYSVVLGLDPDTTHNLAFGSWIHQIFEDCDKEPSDEQKATGRKHLTNEGMVMERFEVLFDESVFPNQAIARQFRADGRKILKNYIKYLKPGEAALAEHTFRVELDGHRITGRIDRVDRVGKNLVVSDYKTSRRPIFWDVARQSLQLAIYYLAATEDETLSGMGTPVSMQLVYPFEVRKNDVSKRCQTPEESRVVLEGLPALLEGVIAEDFRPSPEADCMWCRFKPICPMWPEGRELPA